ncbi:MAG: hypothetical protein AAGF24_12935 [Cyanobacteria bacterium P01_H01_bin.121]
MSAKMVIDFLQRAAMEPELRAELEEILEVGDGDVSNIQTLDAAEADALKGFKGVLVAGLAAELGFPFSITDLTDVIDAFERTQAGTLSPRDLPDALGVPDLVVPDTRQLAAVQSVARLAYRGVSYRRPAGQAKRAGVQRVLQFMERTASDRTFRQGLQALIGGDGNISNPLELDDAEAKALQGNRAIKVTSFAAQHGFHFSAADLTAVVSAFQRVQAGELSALDCNTILGLESGAGSASRTAVQQTTQMVYRGINFSRRKR